MRAEEARRSFERREERRVRPIREKGKKERKKEKKLGPTGVSGFLGSSKLSLGVAWKHAIRRARRGNEHKVSGPGSLFLSLSHSISRSLSSPFLQAISRTRRRFPLARVWNTSTRSGTT